MSVARLLIGIALAFLGGLWLTIAKSTPADYLRDRARFSERLGTIEYSDDDIESQVAATRVVSFVAPVLLIVVGVCVAVSSIFG